MKLTSPFLGLEERAFDLYHFLPLWTARRERYADVIPASALRGDDAEQNRAHHDIEHAAGFVTFTTIER